MYSNILIATDLSRDSDKLVRCVAGLNDLGCRRAHLVYGIDVNEIGPVRAAVEQAVHAEIEKQKATLARAGIESVGHVAMHPVALEIEAIAKANACSLLVAGSRVHSLAGEIFTGGVASTALTHTRRPLLMLRIHSTDASDAPGCACWPCAPLKHLLFPTDFSTTADDAFAYIKRFVGECSPERITIMHVQDRKRIEPHLENRLDEFNTTDRARLEKLREALTVSAPAAHLDIELPYGHPAREIVDYCGREAVSLVVMGTQGRGFVSEMFLGSVSHNVARHALAPVLLIPSQPQ